MFIEQLQCVTKFTDATLFQLYKEFSQEMEYTLLHLFDYKFLK